MLPRKISFAKNWKKSGNLLIIKQTIYRNKQIIAKSKNDKLFMVLRAVNCPFYGK